MDFLFYLALEIIKPYIGAIVLVLLALWTAIMLKRRP
jgi:hypothetical protein